MKDNKEKKLYNILAILGDIADAPEIARHNKLLQSVYVRGRHAGKSVITASQKASILHPVIRAIATQLFIFRLRNKNELDSIIEELGALAAPNVLLEIYHTATAEDFDFLYVDLMKKNINEMLCQNFSARIQIEDS